MLGTLQAQLREATEAKARADKVRALTHKGTHACVRVRMCCACACVIRKQIPTCVFACRR